MNPRFTAATVAFAALALSSSAWADQEQTAIRPGLWEITFMTPGLAPKFEVTEKKWQRCYTAQEAAAGVNPVLPASQTSKCKNSTGTKGRSTIIYDAMSCADETNYRLRVDAFEGGYRGTLSAWGQLEPMRALVIIKPVEGACP